MPLRAILAAIIVAICWGGNYTASKFALQDFPPFLLLLMRFTGVTLVLLPFALRRPIPNLKHMLVISALLIVVQFALVFFALHMGLSITGSIIATQLGVPFSCILAAILFKDYLGPWRSVGLMLAFVGVMIVAGTPNAAEHWDAFLMTVIGSWSWSSANMYLKTIKQPTTIPLLFWPALFSILPFLLLTYTAEHGQFEALANAHWTSWVGICYSVIFASLVGYGLWNWLVAHNPMSRVMPWSLLMPVAGIGIGSFSFGEPLTPRILLGGALAIAGVGIISLRRPKLAELER